MPGPNSQPIAAGGRGKSELRRRGLNSGQGMPWAGCKVCHARKCKHAERIDD